MRHCKDRTAAAGSPAMAAVSDVDVIYGYKLKDNSGLLHQLTQNLNKGTVSSTLFLEGGYMRLHVRF